MKAWEDLVLFNILWNSLVLPSSTETQLWRMESIMLKQQRTFWEFTPQEILKHEEMKVFYLWVTAGREVKSHVHAHPQGMTGNILMLVGTLTTTKALEQCGMPHVCCLTMIRKHMGWRMRT